MDNLIEVPNLEGFKDYEGKEYKHSETVMGRESAARASSRQRLKEMRGQTQPTVNVNEKLPKEDIKEKEIKRPQIIDNLTLGIDEMKGLQYFTKERKERNLYQAEAYLINITHLSYKEVESLKVLLAAAIAGSNMETVNSFTPEVGSGKITNPDSPEISQAIFESNRKLQESPMADKSDLGRHGFMENLKKFIACAMSGNREESITSLVGGMNELRDLPTADQKRINQLITNESNNLAKGSMGKDHEGRQTYKYINSLRTLIGITLLSRV